MVSRKNQFQSNIFLSYGILAVVYITFLLIGPASNQLFPISVTTSGSYRVLVLTIILPYVAVWFLAFYAYDLFNKYCKLVEKTPEGKGFRAITKGVAVLAWGLIVPNIISLILNAIGQRIHTFMTVSIITTNYVSLVVPLIAFTLIGNGSRHLTEISHARPTSIGTRILAFLSVSFGVIYTYLTLHSRHVYKNPYHLSLPLLIITIIIPYLYSWFIGLLAVYELRLYARKSKGLLYRNIMDSLSYGISFVVISSIMQQSLRIILAYRYATSHGLQLEANFLLALVGAIGYLLIATAVHRLKRIEEI
jgi:hypothetical protein